MFESSELSRTPRDSLCFWKSGDKGAFFFGSVSFGQTKEMNALVAAKSFDKKRGQIYFSAISLVNVPLILGY